MISNQILQSNIEGLKEITRIDLCVCDVEGKVLASTFEHAEEYESSILAFVTQNLGMPDGFRITSHRQTGNRIRYHYSRGPGLFCHGFPQGSVSSG